MILCNRCGHRALYHSGVDPRGYSHPRLSCRFETDRYEVCSCDKLEVSHDAALQFIRDNDKDS